MTFTTIWTIDMNGEDVQVSLSTIANEGESQSACVARHLRRVRTYLDTATFKPMAGSDLHTFKDVGGISDSGVVSPVGSDWSAALTAHTTPVLGAYP